MNIDTYYVHTLGDSTLDNLYWILESKKIDAEQAKQASVEGQLETKLNSGSQSAYRLISHAYDGFTTTSVLSGDYVGRVLRIASGSPLKGHKKVYAENKIENANDQYFVQPLSNLKKFVTEHSEAIHYVIISVGGNDFRERLGNPIAMLREIPHIHERYLQILREVNPLKDKNIRPILMLQYRLDTHQDHYRIYTILKVIGVFFTALHSLSLLGIGASAMALAAKRIYHRAGFVFLLISASVLALSQQVIPLKVTKGVLLGQRVSMAALGGLMETFYRPILAQAKADGIPILDLPNTFNPDDHELYIAQIEPSQKGGQLIAEGINHIIENHDFASPQSMIYSKRDSLAGFTASKNPGSRGWSVAYPAKVR